MLGKCTSHQREMAVNGGLLGEGSQKKDSTLEQYPILHGTQVWLFKMPDGARLSEIFENKCKLAAATMLPSFL